MRYPILAALLDEADRIRLAAATEAAGRDLLSESTPLPVLVIAEHDPRLPDLMRRMDAARPMFPALPPLPDVSRVFDDLGAAAKDADRAMAQMAKARPQPQRKPPPCAGHSRLGRPFRVGGESRRPGTADAEKRAKRKAAEKSRRRNRR